MTLRQLIEKHEGRRASVYKCPAGFNTIGVGWNIDANPLPLDIANYLKHNGHITDEMIDRLLDISIRHAQADCRVLFPSFDSFTENRKIALTDFVFNVGFRTARTFKKAVAAINKGKWDIASKEMKDSDWFTQVPNRAKTIIKMVETG